MDYDDNDTGGERDADVSGSSETDGSEGTDGGDETDGGGEETDGEATDVPRVQVSVDDIDYELAIASIRDHAPLLWSCVSAGHLRGLKSMHGRFKMVARCIETGVVRIPLDDLAQRNECLAELHYWGVLPCMDNEMRSHEITYLLAELEAATGQTYRDTWACLRTMAVSVGRDPLVYALEWAAQRKHGLPNPPGHG